MLSKCCSCFKALSWKFFGHHIPKWQTHLLKFCEGRAQNQPWCHMFLDNMNLITEHSLPKQIQNLVRSTNLSSEIIKIIDNHYQQQSNLFRFCVQLFGSYLKLKYSETVNPSKKTLNRIAYEHQEFTKLLIDLFVLYFDLEDRQIVGQQTFYKSTLPALANHFTFENLDIQVTVNRTAKLALKTQIDKLQFQTQKFLGFSINQYELRSELKLNQCTLAFYHLSEGNIEERLYSGAIQIVKQIVRVNSPAEKMKLVEGLQKQIESSVLNFYKKNNIKMQKIDINAQDLTSILMYIIVQANVAVFFAHLQIAIMFSPSSSKADSIVECLLNAFQNLQNGSILPKQYSNLLSQSTQFRISKIEETFFFDEVRNVHL